MIWRSDPSYAPIARLCTIGDGRRRQRAHRSASRLITLQEGSGSPHVRQHGGVIGTMDDQHASQTTSRVGESSGCRHAAHVGATHTAMRLSATKETIPI